MSKMNYTKYTNRTITSLDSEYWSKPSQGFDKQWHTQRKANVAMSKAFAQKIADGPHGAHALDVVKDHPADIQANGRRWNAGRIHCKTCDKWVAFIPKNIVCG